MLEVIRANFFMSSWVWVTDTIGSKVLLCYLYVNPYRWATLICFLFAV